MKLNGWIWASIVGLLIIIFQILFPDPVPDAINKLLSQDNSGFIGFEAALKAFLLLYLVGGYAFFLGGIVGAVISHRRS